FQIVYRLLHSGLKSKILYLADRNILVDQSIEQDFSPLKKFIHKINYSQDKDRQITSYEVYFSLYQQLIGDDGEKRYEKLFKPGFFDFIIIDECHRGSANADKQWHDILKYFSSATQLGMTATPKETEYASNINYFGEPVYKYSLNDGIQDGFLAPFKVVEPVLNVADGWRPVKGQKDIYGNEIEDRIYNNLDYDYNIILQDRVRAVAEEITNYLKASDRMQKTIVFCANQDAAERMRAELTKLNADMMKNHPDYVVRITSSDNYGKSKLEYFISIAEPYPVIATTSELLSTGVDTKTVKLIVIDKNISSMTQFKQIIGRGTRIVEKADKLSFVIMDLRGVSRHFADPDWDGPIDIDPDFGKGKKSPEHPIIDWPPLPPLPPQQKPIVDKDGCSVFIIQKRVLIYDASGKLLRQESIIDYTKRSVCGEFATLDNFILKWSSMKKKRELDELLKEKGLDLEVLKREQNMADVDDFDFICHVAFDKKPLTRAERAEKVKRSDFFSKYSGTAREILETLLEKYKDLGVFEIENNAILKSDPLNKFGSPSKIISYFDGKEGYTEALRKLEEIIYKAG
ncbi:MAG: DEAD/DEAH box helicase family protein, partial [Synergistaceae bacterium]|nr:DEAD/DEAH box helicase family protein [Synergistaceae bacterium]